MTNFCFPHAILYTKTINSKGEEVDNLEEAFPGFCENTRRFAKSFSKAIEKDIKLNGVITEDENEMAKLTTKKRNALPKSEFAGADRSYPVPDKSHAVNAKARATQMVNKGKLSPAAKAKIDAKANKVLGKKK